MVVISSTSGSIISKNWIVTADDDNYPLTVSKASADGIKAGISFIPLPPEVDLEVSYHRVEKIIRYKSNNSDSQNPISFNKIVLIRVKEPFVFDKTRKPIKLFNAGEKLYPGKIAQVSGFGLLPINGSSWPYRLHSREVTIMDSELCNQIYKAKDITNGLPKGFICTDYEKNMTQKNIKYLYEYGGGSLIVDGRLAGIVVSTADQVTNLQNPKFFIDVAYYRDWIDQHVDQPLL